MTKRSGERDLRRWDPATGKLTHRRDGSSVQVRLPSNPPTDVGSAGPASDIPAKGSPNPDRAIHGALSPAIYGARAAELIEQLLTSRPDLAEFPSAVKSWAVAEARAELLRAHEARVGLLDGDDPRAFTKLSVQVENQLKDARRVLGLDPMAAAALAKERASAAVVSVNLSQMAEQGRAVLDARTDPVAELLAGEELI